MAKRAFNKEFLQAVLDRDAEGVELICDNLVESTRWSLIYDAVFKFEGKFYKTSYSTGATEEQWEAPFEYDDDIIECEEVKEVEYTAKKWVPVEAE